MWIVICQNFENEISIVKEGLTITDAQSVILKTDADEKEYLLWDGDWPANKAELNKLMENIFKFNAGKDLRIFPNANINIDQQPITCGCPTRCFCQWENGRCSCWTSWCRQNGCIWVRCDGRC